MVSLAFAASAAPALKTENVFLIMTDGFRWQEVFTGAEEELISKEFGGVKDTNRLRQDFWRDTPEERRAALLPFFWSEIATRGQIFGNQQKGSTARVTNGRNFSYPGYSEMVTGIADARIDSNAKKPNPNVSVFEWLNGRPAFTGKVAAFANWDVVPFILNTERSKLPVWTGLERKTDPKHDAYTAMLEELVADSTPSVPGMTHDTFIHHAALHHLRSAKPRALYVVYGETDEWAHEGRYDLYLRAANHADRFIKTLWDTAQSLPEYRDKTTFIITTDHGRGTDLFAWKNHGQAVTGSGFIWAAVIGPDTAPLGERTNAPLLTQNQFAATIAALLGEDYLQAFPEAGPPIVDVFPPTK